MPQRPLTITLTGPLKGKGRPRAATSKKTGKSFQYTPADTRKYEQQVAWEAKQAILKTKWRVTRAPVRLDIYIWHKRPKALKKSEADLPPCRVPDMDNIEKILMDALNTVVWKDDKQVVEKHTYKYWGDDPGVFIRVSEIG